MLIRQVLDMMGDYDRGVRHAFLKNQFLPLKLEGPGRDKRIGRGVSRRAITMAVDANGHRLLGGNLGRDESLPPGSSPYVAYPSLLCSAGGRGTSKRSGKRELPRVEQRECPLSFFHTAL